MRALRLADATGRNAHTPRQPLVNRRTGRTQRKVHEVPTLKTDSRRGVAHTGTRVAVAAAAAAAAAIAARLAWPFAASRIQRACPLPLLSGKLLANRARLQSGKPGASSECNF